jgi:hypothetical protein
VRGKRPRKRECSKVPTKLSLQSPALPPDAVRRIRSPRILEQGVDNARLGSLRLSSHPRAVASPRIEYGSMCATRSTSSSISLPTRARCELSASFSGLAGRPCADSEKAPARPRRTVLLSCRVDGGIGLTAALVDRRRLDILERRSHRHLASELSVNPENRYHRRRLGVGALFREVQQQ